MSLAAIKDLDVQEAGWVVLVRAVEQLAGASDLSDIIAIVRATARDISGADGVCFVVRDGDHCHYIEENAIAPLWKGKRFPMNTCISGWCMYNNAPAVISDIFADPRIPHDVYRATFVKSLVMVPVLAQRPIGAIGVYWAQPRDFSSDELSLIEALGRSTSAAIATVQMRDNWRESERRLAMALDAGGLGAWDLGLAGGELITTARCREIFGRTADAPLSYEELLDIIHPDDRAKAGRIFTAGPQPNEGDEYRIRCPGGERRIEMRGRVVRDANGEAAHVSGVVRDVTERYLAKERLDALRAEITRAARLNDLGAMASALAHELNQPLAAASNYMHAAERLMERDPAKARDAITKGEAQFLRTKEIIQRIRGFIGQGENIRTAENITQACDEIIELGRSSAVYRHVAVKTDFPADLPKVEIDKVQIQQVLLNLIRNAIEAMVHSEMRLVTVSARVEDGMVCVRVADTGPGLAPEIAENLFRPFQSTKEGGMGVGLTLCRKIVDHHGGKLWHEASEKGAVFAFSLPLAD